MEFVNRSKIRRLETVFEFILNLLKAPTIMIINKRKYPCLILKVFHLRYHYWRYRVLTTRLEPRVTNCFNY